LTDRSVLTLAGLAGWTAFEASRPAQRRAALPLVPVVLQWNTQEQVFRMPTENPRVNVTLSPSLYDLVGAMARAQRVSRSQVLRELLEAAEPALQRVVKMMDAAERAKGAVKAGFAENLLRSQQVLEQELERQLSMVDGVSTDLVTLAERIQGRRPARAAQPRTTGGALGENPPASNRGVKSTKTTEEGATPPHRPHRGIAPKRVPTKGGRR